MRGCHCTLPYSNPNACQGCPNNTEEYEIKPYAWTQPVKNPLDYESMPKKYIVGKWYIVTHISGNFVSNYVCYCCKILSHNYTMICQKPYISFIFNPDGKWIDNKSAFPTTETAFIINTPYDSENEARQNLDNMTLKDPKKEEKKETKMKNKLDENTLQESIDKIVNILIEGGRTFTPHIITQILRKTDAFISHQDVREYFNILDEEGWLNRDYVVGYAYVNNSPAKSRVYHVDDGDGHIKNDISISVDDFSGEIEEFLKWFNANYEYQEEDELKVTSVGPVTITLPQNDSTVYYLKNPNSTISISGTISKDSGITSGSTSVSNLPAGTTIWNTGWDNWKNMKRGPDGKWTSK